MDLRSEEIPLNTRENQTNTSEVVIQRILQNLVTIIQGVAQ